MVTDGKLDNRVVNELELCPEPVDRAEEEPVGPELEL